MAKVILNKPVILSQRRRIRAQAEGDTALFDFRFGFLVLLLKS
jgi:hypothetical protein